MALARRANEPAALAVLEGMAGQTYWETLIHEGGRPTGPVLGTIATQLVVPRWLRFMPARVFVTITGVDEVEAWVRGATTADEAKAVHDALVIRYTEKARAIGMARGSDGI